MVSAKQGAPVLHTNNLLNGVVANSGEHVLGPVLTGPALLFPRVGLITPGKLCVLRAGRRVTLSDCVLGVACLSEADAEHLKRVVLAAWPTFAFAYRGTGAPYITVERASELLAKITSASRPMLPVAASEVML